MLGNYCVVFHILLPKLTLVQVVDTVKKHDCQFLIRKYNVFMFDLEWTEETLQKHQLPSLPAINTPHSSEFEGATHNKASHKSLVRNT